MWNFYFCSLGNIAMVSIYTILHKTVYHAFTIVTIDWPRQDAMVSMQFYTKHVITIAISVWQRQDVIVSILCENITICVILSP